jgi:hypothetical protein
MTRCTITAITDPAAPVLTLDRRGNLLIDGQRADLPPDPEDTEFAGSVGLATERAFSWLVAAGAAQTAAWSLLLYVVRSTEDEIRDIFDRVRDPAVSPPQPASAGPLVTLVLSLLVGFVMFVVPPLVVGRWHRRTGSRTAFWIGLVGAALGSVFAVPAVFRVIAVMAHASRRPEGGIVVGLLLIIEGACIVGSLTCFVKALRSP